MSVEISYRHRAIGLGRFSLDRVEGEWTGDEAAAETLAASLRCGRVETQQITRTWFANGVEINRKPHRTRDVPPARSSEGEAATPRPTDTLNRNRRAI